MKVSPLKSFLWFGVALSLALSFPLQVTLGSPLPSLFPYFGVALIFLLSLFTSTGRQVRLFRWNIVNRINLILTLYLVLVFYHTTRQLAFGLIPVSEGVTIIFIFVAPLIFFIYFREIASEREIRAILFAIALAGLIIGFHFAYDSYLKLVLHETSDYAWKAMNYTLDRMGLTLQEAHTARVSPGRSFGLLESHRVTAAWIALGGFAALTLTQKSKIWTRTGIIMVYGMLLLMGLYFTSIIGFAVVIILMEFRALEWLRGRLSRRNVTIAALTAIAFVSFALFFGAIVGEFFYSIEDILRSKVSFGTRGTSGLELGYFDRFVEALASYPRIMGEFSLAFTLGDGFSREAFLFRKGGDFGLADTLFRFGLPFFLTIVIGLTALVVRSIKQIGSRRIGRPMESRYLWFAVSVTIYLAFADIHYSVWPAKSVLPIFFLALAMYARYLRHRAVSGGG